MKYHFKLTAVSLQYALIGSIVIGVAGLGFVFYTAHTVLNAKVVETDHARSDADIALEEISRLQQLKKILADDDEVIKKTAKIVADSQKYTFQDQVIADITSYASAANVPIKQFDFGVKPGETVADTTGSKLRRTTVTVTTMQGVSATALLTLLRALENNVTKMQLTGIDIKPAALDPTTLQESSLILEIYIR